MKVTYDDVVKRYGTVLGVDRLSLQIRAGEFVCLARFCNSNLHTCRVLSQPFVRFAYGNCNRDGKTALTGAAKHAVGDNSSSRFRFGVRQDDYMILRATLVLHTLSVGGGTRKNVARYR
jgi:hypothetical protein